MWEWTSDWFSPVHFLTEENQQIGFVDPTGPSVDDLEQLVPEPKNWWKVVIDLVQKRSSVIINVNECHSVSLAFMTYLK